MSGVDPKPIEKIQILVGGDTDRTDDVAEPGLEPGAGVEGVIGIELVALAQEHAAVAAAVAVDAPFEPVVDPLTVIHQVEPGETIRIEDIRLVELEIEAVFVGNQAVLPLLGAISAEKIGSMTWLVAPERRMKG